MYNAYIISTFFFFFNELELIICAKLTDCRLVEAFAFVQEMRNVLGVHLKQVILAQVLDSCVDNNEYIYTEQT